MAVINSSRFDFREVVQKYLEEQRYEIIDCMSEAIDEVAKESVKKLKAESPRARPAHITRDGHTRSRRDAYSTDLWCMGKAEPISWHIFLNLVTRSGTADAQTRSRISRRWKSGR